MRRRGQGKGDGYVEKGEGYVRVRRGGATDEEREGDDCKFSAAFFNGKDRQWDSRRAARGQGLARPHCTRARASEVAMQHFVCTLCACSTMTPSLLAAVGGSFVIFRDHDVPSSK